MKAEYRYLNAIEFFRELGIPADRTTVYCGKPELKIESEKRFENFQPGGVFFPRFFEGHIWNYDSIYGFKRPYTHELAHGAFCENFLIGQRFHQLDKKIWKLENRYFKEVKPPVQLVQKGCPPRIDVDLPIIELEKREFEEYLSTRARLDAVYDQHWNDFEGFAMLCEEQIFEEFDRDNLNPSYRQAYNYIKTKEQEYEGFEGLIEFYKQFQQE